MIIADIIARLSAVGTPFAIVDGANALSEVMDRPPNIPAAYVYVGKDASGPNERMTGPVLQRTEADISVLIVTENQSSSLSAATDIEELKGWVRGRLIGYVPDGAEAKMEHVTGEIVQAKDRMVWFEDVFATAFYLREQG